jgi:hypothetical protein
VRALFVDHAGTRWAASSNSVCSLSAGSDGFHEFKSGLDAASEIDAVVEDRAGTRPRLTPWRRHLAEKRSL